MRFSLSKCAPTWARMTGLWVGLLTFALVLAGCDSSVDDGDMPDDPTITERVTNNNDLSTLANALQKAGLDQDLNDENATFTVFAPRNSAFDGVDVDELLNDADLLSEVLEYHVVSGQAIQAGDIQDGQTVETVEGDTLELTVDGSSVQVNGAPVTSADVPASNGVVHVIDGALLETVDVVDRATVTSQLSTLADAINAAGLDGSNSALRNDAVTVFAPIDSAFAPLDVDELVGDSQILNRVLTHHVISGKTTSGDLSGGETPTTLEGGTLQINVNSGTVTVNGIPVTTADIQTENGVVHVIDGVLLERLDAVQRATVTSAFSILTDLVSQENLASTLSGPGPDGEDGITVFAPTNQVFLDALDQNDNGDIDDSEVPSNVGDILKYHVVDDIYFAGDVPTSETDLPTLEGSNVTVVRSGSDVTLNPNAEAASVAAPDVNVRNGVIHGIDTLLQIP